MGINWKQVAKKADGSIGKKARIMLRGVGTLMGGQFSASVDCGVMELAPSGKAKAVLQWRRNGQTKPLVWQAECACLDAAELALEEEGIAAMGVLLAAEGKKDLHPSDTREVVLKSWEQVD